MHEVGIGLIGSGFMGKAHAFAYRAAHAAYPDIPVVRLVALADANAEAAAKAALQYPAVDIVSITTPNALHKEMALAAIAEGTESGPGFREACEIQKVVEAALASSLSRCWRAL